MPTIANAVTVTEAIFHRIEALEGDVIPSSMKAHVTRDYGHTALEKSNELLFHLGLATCSHTLSPRTLAM